jgi:hypothetical protein
MRVQLRDCNPPRSGNWRYSGRGRGRFPHYPSQRRYPETSDQPHEPPPSGSHDEESGVTDVVREIASLSIGDEKSVADPISGPEPPADFAVTSYAEEEQPQAAPQLREDQTQSCPASRRASPGPTHAPEAPPQPQYREWYDEPTSATMTPPLPSAAVPSTPYPIPNGYYPPPWAQPYPQPYGMSYYPGFPGYPTQGPQPPSQPYSSPGGSDASGPASGPAQRPWPMYGVSHHSCIHRSEANVRQAYISYPAYPRPPNVDPTSPRGQAPLQPTGFIQNEQGTLIPVYQPEALDQYMASNQAAPPTTPITQPQNGAATWQQYPPPSHGFPNPIHPMMGMPRAFPPQPQQGVNGGWVPGQFQSPHPSSHAAQSPNVPNHTGNFRGGYQDVGGGQGMGPNGRRHPGRRDQHPNGPNTSRNNPGRPMPNRHARGGMHHMGYTPHEGAPQIHLSHPTQFNSTPADWNQWPVAR